MWKDILFGGAMLMLTIFIIEMITNMDEFFSKNVNLVYLLLISVAVALLRHNGYCVLLLCFPLLILFIGRRVGKRREWKTTIKLTVVFVALLVIQYMLTGPLFSVLDIRKGSIREALSVPLQQIARVIKYHEDELSDYEREVIGQVVPVDIIGGLYNPRLSNPVKNHFSDNGFEDNRKEFFDVWFKLFSRYPVDYINAYIANSFGYWYPETSYWTATVEMEPNVLGLEHKHFANLRDVIDRSGIMNLRYIPGVSMIYSIGFWVILLLIMFIYQCIKKQYLSILAFAPLVLLVLTTTASPVYAEYRYVFSLFTSLPILLGISLKVTNSNLYEARE